MSASSGKQGECEKEGTLQGTGPEGNGYDHCYPDLPATISLEMNDAPPVKS